MSYPKSRKRRRLRFQASESAKRLNVESLEDRRMLAGIWDGGGDGVSWGDAANWDDNQVPSDGSDIFIETIEGAAVVAEGVQIDVNSLNFASPSEFYLKNSNLHVSSPTFTNQATIILDNSSWQSANEIVNQSLIGVLGNSTIIAPMVQSGYLAIEPDAELFVVGEIHNFGTIDLIEAKLNLQDGTLNNVDGRVIGGGTIDSNFQPILGGQFEGLLQFQNSIFNVQAKAERSTGTFSFEGDVAIDANSVIQLEIGGTQAGVEHDQILIQGSAQIDASFEIQIADGFQPSVCDEFTIARSNSPLLGNPNFGETFLGNGLVLRPRLTETEWTLVAVDPRLPINYSAANEISGSGESSYNVCLGMEPNDQVSIGINAPLEIEVDANEVTFSPTEWQEVRTVSVSYVGPQQADDQSFVINHIANSNDPIFDSRGNPLLQGNVVVPVAGVEPVVPDEFETVDNAVSELRTADQTLEGLSIHAPGDDDWFLWRAAERGVFAVDTFFDASLGELDVELYDSNDQLIAWSATTTDNEHIAVPVVPGDEIQIRVFGFYEAVHPNYDLVVRLNPDTPRIYVSSDSQIDVFNELGEPQFVIQHELLSAGNVGDVEIGSGNLVYVYVESEGEKSLLEFTSRGTFSRQISLPAEAAPAGREFDGFEIMEDSTILIGAENQQVFRMAFDGRQLETFQFNIENADVIVRNNGTIASSDFANQGNAFLNNSFDGNVWVAAPTTQTVSLSDPFGNSLREINTPGANPIEAVETDRGRVFAVARTGNDSGQLLDIDLASGQIQRSNIAQAVNGFAISDIEIPSRTPKPDRDADGLLDDWETFGIDIDDDGIIDLDLPNLGADPLHKDVFVEVDAMVDRAPVAIAQPIPAVVGERLATGTVLDRVIESFLSAPVPNPDGVDGIRLHVLTDELELPQQVFKDRWTEFDRIKNGSGSELGHFGSVADRDHVNWHVIREARKHVFRYALFADQFEGRGASGVAETPGNDLIVTLGSFEPTGGNSDQQASTFMHELGHTLGLKHGGADDVNFKPNYFSTMNYHWQFPWPQNAGWQLDYSRERLDSLDELKLHESHGIGMEPEPGEDPAAVQAGPLPLHQVPLFGEVDWDQDGKIDVDPTIADINRGFADTNADGFVNVDDESPGEFLRGHNDWQNLRFRFTDLQNLQEFRDGEIDRPEDPDGDPTDLYNDIPADFYDPDNDQREDASEIGVIESLIGLTIDSLDDVDWFELLIDFSGDLIVGGQILGTAASVLQVTIFDQLGNEIDLQAEQDQLVSHRTQVSPGDRFFVKVNVTPESVPTRYALLLNPGDADFDHVYSPADIDVFCDLFRIDDYDKFMDLNQDSTIDMADIDLLLETILGTSRGDADLNGIFNSSDFISIFQAGQYEDSVALNSTWATGDWNCDQEFDTSDLTEAFIAGGYTLDARTRLPTIDPKFRIGAAIEGIGLVPLEFDFDSKETKNKNRGVL